MAESENHEERIRRLDAERAELRRLDEEGLVKLASEAGQEMIEHMIRAMTEDVEREEPRGTFDEIDGPMQMRMISMALERYGPRPGENRLCTCPTCRKQRELNGEG